MPATLSRSIDRPWFKEQPRGEIVRKFAILPAGRSFTHLIIISWLLMDFMDLFVIPVTFLAKYKSSCSSNHNKFRRTKTLQSIASKTRLRACSQLGEIYSGACVHGFIEKTIWVPESDVFIGTGLVDMYAKCGYIDSALSIFRLMSVKNVLTWTAMGTGLAVHGRGKEALELLDAMEGSGRAGYLNEAYDFIIEIPIKPDAVLWRSLLSACTIHGDLAMAEKVGKILLRLEPPKNSLHMPITSEDYIALSNVYASTGRWRQVEMVRNKMKLKRVETKPGGSYIRTVCSSP
ncbi:hypothetical protein V6Z12_A11G261300 [Gossypium hirsutum]